MKKTRRRDLYMAMDITDRCNLRCAMCFRAVLPAGPNEDMSVEQFRTIGDHCFHRAAVLALSCAAEPLLSRHFGDIMQALPAYSIPSTELVTNGMLLNEAKIEAMLDARLSRLILSIDGATAATYESIRTGASFDRLLTNLRLLQKIKADRRVSRPLLRLNFVMMRCNIEELPALIELAADLGARQVTAQHMTIYEGCMPPEESLYGHQALANRMLIQAHRLAARSGIAFHAPPLFASSGRSPADLGWLLFSRGVAGLGMLRDFGRARLLALGANFFRRRWTNPDAWCHHPWEILFIDPAGNIRPCVNWGTEPTLGNCLEQSLDEIWEGAAYRQLRDELTGKLPRREACLRCPAVASGKVDDATAFEEIPL